MIPEGRYKAVAVAVPDESGNSVKAQWGTAKTGSRQVLIHFEIVEGDQAGLIAPWFGYFTEKTAERTLQALRYAGWKGDDLMNLGPLDQVVDIVVEHNETQDGKIYPRVAWVNRPGGGGIKLANPMSENELRQFAAQMKRHAAAIGEVDGEKRDAAAPSGSNGASGGGRFDDDNRPPMDSYDDGVPF